MSTPMLTRPSIQVGCGAEALRYVHCSRRVAGIESIAQDTLEQVGDPYVSRRKENEKLGSFPDVLSSSSLSYSL